MSDESIHRLEFVRVTEAAALTAARWTGLGDSESADAAAGASMNAALQRMAISGRIAQSEAEKLGHAVPTEAGSQVGTGDGTPLDLVLDPIDGRRLVAEGREGALSVLAVAPRGSLWAPQPAVYMDKLIVDSEVGDAIVPECLDAPAGWTLALIARQKRKRVGDLIVFVLDRPRHEELIDEIRSAGARVMLRAEGDIAGAVWAGKRGVPVDALMGQGGVTEGILAACAIKALGGAMLGRLAPQSTAEQDAVIEAGHDLTRVMTASDIASSPDTAFVATGITGGPILKSVRFHGDWAETSSLVLSGETSRFRLIDTEHLVLPDQ